jgi:hypothetical protein
MRENMSNEIKIANCVQEFFGATAPKSQVEIFNASAFCSAGVVTGDKSKSLVEGIFGVAVSTGDESSSEVLGGKAVAVSTGYKGTAITAESGLRSAAVVTADDSTANSNQKCGVAVSTGDDSDSSSKGIRGVSVATGYESVSSSYGEKSVSVGNAYGNTVSAMAAESIAVAWGPGSKAKGVIGTYLVLSEWEYTGKWYDLEYESATVWADKWKLVGQKFVLVDGTSIKADTWYHLVSGEVKEVKEDDDDSDVQK